MLYVLSSAMTGAGAAADDFLGRVASRASLHHPTSSLSSPAATALAQPGPDDGVVFANGEDTSPEAADFLERAAAAGAVLLPIALDSAHRRPPVVAEAAQSFDVTDALRRSGLPDWDMSSAARIFTRTALSRLAPTCFRSRLRLFLSYRRDDGEALTAELDKALSDRHEHVFRDLVDIQTGEVGQDVIDEKLREADVVIFIDTPRAGESEWIARELATAMGNGIPVVWVRIGPADGRVALPVPPGRDPLVDCTDAASPDIGALAELVLDAAHNQVVDAIRASTSAFEGVRRWAEKQGATVSALDQRRLIYSVQIVSPGSETLPRRSRQDIVQIFARNPDEDDVNALADWLRSEGYADHPLACRAFDAAVLIRPSSLAAVPVRDWGVVGSGEGYLSELSGGRSNASVVGGPRLLVLGAFPSEPETHPAVIAAVSTISRQWLRQGGRIVFGSHPTFSPLMAEAGRAVLPRGAKHRILAVRSGFFAKPSFEPDMTEAMTIEEVPAGDDLESSLTAMRVAMIRPGAAEVAVVVGGRTAEGDTHTPGVEEELDLARRAGIPVVVVASPGGQAAVIAGRERESSPAWSGLANGLPVELNERIAGDDDYAEVAQVIWEYFGAETHLD